jgi:putative peptidoglycan lipid II flippase
VALMGSYAQVGLAFATAIGAWVNVALVVWFAMRARLFAVDARVRLAVLKLAVAGVALALALMASERWFEAVFGDMRRLRAEVELATLVCVGGVVYCGAVAALFGRRWLRDLSGKRLPPGGPGRGG